MIIQNDENKPVKCNDCYYKPECMLTPFMAKMCGGPWENLAERLKFIEENVVGK